VRLGRRVVIPKRVIDRLLDVDTDDVSVTRRDVEQSDLPRLDR